MFNTRLYNARFNLHIISTTTIAFIKSLYHLNLIEIGRPQGDKQSKNFTSIYSYPASISIHPNSGFITILLPSGFLRYL